MMAGVGIAPWRRIIPAMQHDLSPEDCAAIAALLRERLRPISTTSSRAAFSGCARSCTSSTPRAAATPADLPGEVRLQIVSSCAQPGRGDPMHEVTHDGTFLAGEPVKLVSRNGYDRTYRR